MAIRKQTNTEGAQGPEPSPELAALFARYGKRLDKLAGQKLTPHDLSAELKTELESFAEEAMRLFVGRWEASGAKSISARYYRGR
jgi:hypothetical protein